MKEGKWNYSEDIKFKVVNVRVHTVPDKPMYWQNALDGQVIQAVLVYTQEPKDYHFLIANEGGEGLKKVEMGGGPNMSSHHIDSHFDILEDVPEEDWNEWDPHALFLWGEMIDKWQEEHHPEEHAKKVAMMKAWANSPMNPNNIYRK